MTGGRDSGPVYEVTCAPTIRRFGATLSAPSLGGLRSRPLGAAGSKHRRAPAAHLSPESAAGAPLTAGVVSMLGSVDDRVTSPADVRAMTVRRWVAVAGHPPDEHLVRPPGVSVRALLGSLLYQRTEHAFEDRSVRPADRYRQLIFTPRPLLAPDVLS